MEDKSSTNKTDCESQDGFDRFAGGSRNGEHHEQILESMRQCITPKGIIGVSQRYGGQKEKKEAKVKIIILGLEKALRCLKTTVASRIPPKI